MKKLLLIIFITCFKVNALEMKSNVLTSLSNSGDFDLILNSHNTVLIGGSFKVGPYFAYERLHSYVTDMAYGGAMRFGDKGFIELQGAYLERDFRGHTGLKGKGFVVNMLTGAQLGSTFGLTLLFSAKKIESGLDPRWIFKVLPYLGVSFEF